MQGASQMLQNDPGRVSTPVSTPISVGVSVKAHA